MTHLALVGLLGAATAGLMGGCGSSGAGLIPTQNAGPLQSDFEEVAKAAQAGNGNCAATDEALAKTEQDFAALPPTVNAGLHRTLQVGIANLSERARAACVQPLAGTTATGTSSASTTRTSSSTSTTSSPTSTTTTSTSTTSTVTPPTATTTPGVGGGTQAPPGESGAPGAGSGQGNGLGNGEGNGQGDGQGNGHGQAGGTGESDAGAGPGAGR